jgi:predicted esterase
MANIKRKYKVSFVHTAVGTPFVMLPVHTGKKAPTLLLFAMSGKDTLSTEPYCIVGRLLHAQGWNVVSLDLPCHGADIRENEPAELNGWAARIGSDEDITAEFQLRVNDVVDHLIGAGIANQNRFAAAGTSRGGYMAFQAAIGNPNIRAIAAFSPVTDLLALGEFTGQEDNPLVLNLALEKSANTLADRAAWIYIGDADERVSTGKAVAFAQALETSGCETVLRVVQTPGHASFPEWHTDAAAWLQKVVPSS